MVWALFFLPFCVGFSLDFFQNKENVHVVDSIGDEHEGDCIGCHCGGKIRRKEQYKTKNSV